MSRFSRGANNVVRGLTDALVLLAAIIGVGGAMLAFLRVKGAIAQWLLDFAKGEDALREARKEFDKYGR